MNLAEIEERNTGLCWHVHHDILVEWCTDFKERVAYIQADKSLSEVPIRLARMQFVKAVPPGIIEVGAAYDHARAAYRKATAAYSKATAAYSKAWATFNKATAATAAYDRAWAAFNKATAAYSKATAAYSKAEAAAMPELEALHKIECVRCPWNGRTLFPARVRAKK